MPTIQQFFTPSDVLLTHKDCMDGAGCAIVFQACGGQRGSIHYTPPDHSKVDIAAINLVNTCRGKLYIADVSVSQATAVILGRSSKVRLLDHHKSAIPLSKYSWCEIDAKNLRCGSQVLLDYVIREGKYNGRGLDKLRRFISAIDDRDRWVNSDPFSGDLNDLFQFMQQQNFVEEFSDNYSLEFDERLKFIIQIERANRQRYCQSLLESVQIKTLYGARVGFSNCTYRYISDAGNLLCQVHRLDAVLLVTPTSISMRSGVDSCLDMSVIAKTFGGGGHQHAAGFQLENLTGQSSLDWVMNSFSEYDFSNGSTGQYKPKQRSTDYAVSDVS